MQLKQSTILASIFLVVGFAAVLDARPVTFTFADVDNSGYLTDPTHPWPTVNGVELKQGESKVIDVTNNTFRMEYWFVATRTVPYSGTVTTMPFQSITQPTINPTTNRVVFTSFQPGNVIYHYFAQ